MTGTQLKDLWSQWTVRTKSSWSKLISPFTDDVGRPDSVPDIGPRQQGERHEAPKSDIRAASERVGE